LDAFEAVCALAILRTGCAVDASVLLADFACWAFVVLEADTNAGTILKGHALFAVGTRALATGKTNPRAAILLEQDTLKPCFTGILWIAILPAFSCACGLGGDADFELLVALVLIDTVCVGCARSHTERLGAILIANALEPCLT
jgi:hypothetical protein